MNSCVWRLVHLGMEKTGGRTVTIFTVHYHLQLAWPSRNSSTVQGLSCPINHPRACHLPIFLKHLQPWPRAGLCRTHPSRHWVHSRPRALRGPTALHFCLAFSTPHISPRVPGFSWSTPNEEQFLSFPSASFQVESRAQAAESPSPACLPGLGSRDKHREHREQTAVALYLDMLNSPQIQTKSKQQCFLYCKNRTHRETLK